MHDIHLPPPRSGDWGAVNRHLTAGGTVEGIPRENPYREYYLSLMKKRMDETLTNDQLIERYGDVPMKFEGYYKFAFSFACDHEGKHFLCSYGGNADDIYRFELDKDTTILVKDYKTCAFFRVTSGTDVVFEHSDY